MLWTNQVYTGDSLYALQFTGPAIRVYIVATFSVMATSAFEI
jgi:hypothetical protein